MGLCHSAYDYDSSATSSDSEDDTEDFKICPQSSKDVPRKPAAQESKSNKKPVRPVRQCQRTKRPTQKTGAKSGKKRANKKAMLNGGNDKWKIHQDSMEANTSERRERKKKFYLEYDLEELRRGAIVWDKRQGLYPDQIEDIEDAAENAIKKNRRNRRNRMIEESLEWRLF